MEKSKPARGDYYNVWDDYMPELKVALQKMVDENYEMRHVKKWVIETHEDIKDILRRLAIIELKLESK